MVRIIILIECQICKKRFENGEGYWECCSAECYLKHCKIEEKVAPQNCVICKKQLEDHREKDVGNCCSVKCFTIFSKKLEKLRARTNY